MAFTLTFEPREFDENVWQTETDFKKEDYQTWLSGAIETLQGIYEDYDGKEDVYILGDIINMLSNTEMNTKK